MAKAGRAERRCLRCATRSVYALPTSRRGFSRSACLGGDSAGSLKETVGAYKTAGANSGHVAVAQAVAITFGASSEADDTNWLMFRFSCVVIGALLWLRPRSVHLPEAYVS